MTTARRKPGYDEAVMKLRSHIDAVLRRWWTADVRVVTAGVILSRTDLSDVCPYPEWMPATREWIRHEVQQDLARRTTDPQPGEVALTRDDSALPRLLAVYRILQPPEDGLEDLVRLLGPYSGRDLAKVLDAFHAKRRLNPNRGQEEPLNYETPSSVSRSSERFAAEARDTHPYPSDDPLDRLRHTVAVYADSDPDSVAVMATSNIYPLEACLPVTGHSVGVTGLTHGDLRALLDRLDG